ncbi:MAG: hypothetical protein D6729_11715 [Deltaproteobacteria bacterium]|nr:MAG: hypothetical protein D6729_11715 [Deltaproteobacteria bacterium]
MFNLQFSEIVIILVLALILLGPEQLPRIARKLGKLMNELRSTTEELKRTWEREAWEADEQVKEVGRQLRAADQTIEADARGERARAAPGDTGVSDPSTQPPGQAGSEGGTAAGPAVPAGPGEETGGQVPPGGGKADG